MEEKEKIYTYLQFNKKDNLPIFIRFYQHEFNTEILGFFTSMKFSELDRKEVEEVKNSLKTNSKSKILTIKRASFIVTQKINAQRESDNYGQEGIISQDNYYVYRYKNHAMIVYSTYSQEWQMGCFSDFGAVKKEEVNEKIIINRFLSWALLPFDIIGFWGNLVNEGIILEKYKESKGNAIFINIKENNILSFDREIKYDFSIIKFDSRFNKKRKMPLESLVSSLLIHCTFFNLTGHPPQIARLVTQFSKRITGITSSKASFNNEEFLIKTN